MERLKEYDELHKLENQKKNKKKLEKAKAPGEKPFNPNESQQLLLSSSNPEKGKSLGTSSEAKL